MRELKSCPFCGSDMSDFAGMVPEAFARTESGGFSVNCDCGAIGPRWATMEGAVVAWNTRANNTQDSMHAKSEPASNV